MQQQQQEEEEIKGHKEEEEEKKEEQQPLLSYLPRYQVLVCQQHGGLIGSWNRHLKDKHYLSKKQRQAIGEKGGLNQLVQVDARAVTLPRPFEPPIMQLGLPQDGYYCSKERCSFLTINLHAIRKHCNKEHSWYATQDNQTCWTLVKVQTFFQTRGAQRYFIVQDPTQQQPIDEARVQEELTNILSEAQQAKERHNQAMDRAESVIAKTDNTGWYHRTGWQEHLASKDLVLLSRASRMPDRAADKIWLEAAKVVGLAIEQAVAGLSTLNLETRRWLRSPDATRIELRPLSRLQNLESQRRYTSYFTRFVLYSMRAFTDPEGAVVQDADPELEEAKALFPWRSEQRTALYSLLKALAWQGEASQITQMLNFLGSFIFQHVDRLFDSGLIHFLAILGIDPERRRLRLAQDYSSILAGVVYCTRVCAAEILLPAATRDQQGITERRVFEIQRSAFLVDGSYSPMSTMLSLLAYSKHIAINTGNSGSTFWSTDRRTLYIKGKPIVLERFRAMIAGVLQEAERVLWEELMLTPGANDRFEIPLHKIKDDVTFTTRGYSFLDRPGNELGGKLEWLLDRLLASASGEQLRVDGRWQHREVRQYLKKVGQFLELLLFLTHTTGGQPARGTEITSARFQNGFNQDRNIFVIDGQVVFVSRYHKSQALVDKPKVIPRFLPWRVGQLVATFLAYVQPLREHLSHIVLGQAYSDYIWVGDNGEPWETERLTRVMTRETSIWLGARLTTLDYRHAAITIGRQFVPEFGRGVREEVDEDETEEPEQELEGGLDLQAGRTQAMGNSTYGVSLSIVQGLNTQSVAFFGSLSEQWHKVIGLGTRYKKAGEAATATQSALEPQAAFATSDLLESTTTAAAQGKAERKSSPAGAQGPWPTKRMRVNSLNTEAQRPAKKPQLEGDDLPLRVIGPGLGPGSMPRLEPPQLAALATTREAGTCAVGLEAAMQQALRTNQPVTFRSAEQESALRAIIDGQNPLVVVLPTGGGKSVLYMAPACLPDPGITILVIPFRELLHDQLCRMQEAGIQCVEWVEGYSSQATVVVVSADIAGGFAFMTYAMLVDQEGLLRRVVVDECHLTWTSSNYRAKLWQLRNLRSLSCQFILLTATQPPMLEHELAEAMLVRTTRYIRASTVRPNTRYLVQRCPRGSLLEAAKETCQRWLLQSPGGQGVIYCRSRQQCEDLAGELGYHCYHAGLLPEQRATVMSAWKKEKGLIVATSALGTGLDLPGITLVFHVGLPYGMIDFAQESGRGGRAGELMDSLILLEEGPLLPACVGGGWRALDEGAMIAFVQARVECRRAVMSQFLDRQAVTCTAIYGANCDRCGEGRAEWVASNREFAIQEAMVRRVLDELAGNCAVCWLTRYNPTGHRGNSYFLHARCECPHPNMTFKERGVDDFRSRINYAKDSHTCTRCGISQHLCATGVSNARPCQWPSVMAPLLVGVLGSPEQAAPIWQAAGYQGHCKNWNRYREWVGQTHPRRIWGELMSNGMAVLIQAVLWRCGAIEP